MSDTQAHVVFAGGGTGGHLFPGLAVAANLRQRMPEVRITFAGTGKAFEVQRVKGAGFEYFSLPCRPLPRNAGETLRFVTDNLAGLYAAHWFLSGQDATLVVGLGGYASVPMARAAARRRLPTILLEQNAFPGRATRWLAPAATLVCTAFDEIRPHLRAGCRVQTTGNPVRREFSQAAVLHQADRQQRPPRLLVLGGSGGAKMLNEQAPPAIYKAKAALEGWQIVHQTGTRDADVTRLLYRKLGIKAIVAPFIEKIAPAMFHSDLVISRSGGSTLAELAAAGLPAILLPYPHAASDHQRKNADVFVAAGAARLLDERDAADRIDNCLAAQLTQLASDRVLRNRMAEAMRRQERPDACRLVTKAVVDMVLGRSATAVA